MVLALQLDQEWNNTPETQMHCMVCWAPKVRHPPECDPGLVELYDESYARHTFNPFNERIKQP